MTDLNARGETVLKGWFERAVKKCGKDPSVYDFDAEVDRSLTYQENKAKFQCVVDALCGPEIPSRRERAAQQTAEEERSNVCEYCGRGFHFCKKLGSTAGEQLKAHEAYERMQGKAPQFVRKATAAEIYKGTAPLEQHEEVPPEEFL